MQLGMFRHLRLNEQRRLRRVNARCKPEDTLIHVGDFCTRGVAKGIDGLRLRAKATQLEAQRRMIHAEVRNVHVELIKQFHTMQEEQVAMFETLRGAQVDLAKEVAALRKSTSDYARR